MEIYCLNQVNHVSGVDILPLFQAFLACARTGREKEVVFSEAAQIFLQIVQRLSAHIGRAQAAPVPPLAGALKQALDNLTDFHIHVEELAEMAHCSKSYAIRVFKQTYGVTPYAYLLHLKLEAAKVLLRNTRASVAEIAERLGFCDSHYFSGYFKKCTQMTPGQYRKSHFLEKTE